MLGKSIAIERPSNQTPVVRCREYDAGSGACCLKRDAKAGGRLDVLLGVFREPGAREGETDCRLIGA